MRKLISNYLQYMVQREGSQNVVVFSDISKRINDNMWSNRDDERRVLCGYD